MKNNCETIEINQQQRRKDIVIQHICYSILKQRLNQMRTYRNKLKKMTLDELEIEFDKYVK